MPDIFFDKIIRQKCLDFLYELPERFNLQPNPEWSEEDEKIIQSLILAVNKYVFFAGIETNKIVSFLKSLRPSWKPSEEQIEALEKASTNKYLSAEQYDILVSLYEQLKSIQ